MFDFENFAEMECFGSIISGGTEKSYTESTITRAYPFISFTTSFDMGWSHRRNASEGTAEKATSKSLEFLGFKMFLVDVLKYNVGNLFEGIVLDQDAKLHSFLADDENLKKYKINSNLKILLDKNHYFKSLKKKI